MFVTLKDELGHTRSTVSNAVKMQQRMLALAAISFHDHVSISAFSFMLLYSSDVLVRVPRELHAKLRLCACHC